MVVMVTVRLLKPGHPDGEGQSGGRAEAVDTNIFKSNQSNVCNKTMKSQLVFL